MSNASRGSARHKIDRSGGHGRKSVSTSVHRDFHLRRPHGLGPSGDFAHVPLPVRLSFKNQPARCIDHPGSASRCDQREIPFVSTGISPTMNVSVRPVAANPDRKRSTPQCHRRPPQSAGHRALQLMISDRQYALRWRGCLDCRRRRQSSKFSFRAEWSIPSVDSGFEDFHRTRHDAFG